MANSDIEFCKKQLTLWKSNARVHAAGTDVFKRNFELTGHAVDIAVIAGVSALTMGAATKLTAFLVQSPKAMAGAGMLMEATTIGETAAVTTASTAAKTADVGIRVFLGVAAGTAERLTEAKLAEAFLAVTSRFIATTFVTAFTTCVSLEMRGKPPSNAEYLEQFGKSLFLNLVFAWLGSPAAKSPVRSKLIKKLVEEAPTCLSAQGLVTTGKMASSLNKTSPLSNAEFRRVFNGNLAPSRIQAAMKADLGFDDTKWTAQFRAKAIAEAKLWALEASQKLDPYTRNYCKTIDFEKEVPWYVNAGHSWREVLGGDTTVGEGLAKTRTELIVCLQQVRFWEAAVKCLEQMDTNMQSTKISLPGG